MAKAFGYGCAGLMLAGGLALLAKGEGGGVGLTLFGLILALALALEPRYRGSRADLAPPDAEWQRTGERFFDEEAGRWTEVWFNPRTGDRRYAELSDKST